MSEIIFLRSNKISAKSNHGTGLIDLLQIHLFGDKDSSRCWNDTEHTNYVNDTDNENEGTPEYAKKFSNIVVSEVEQTRIFEEITVVVPTQAFAIWLRDSLTQSLGVCANIDFVVLLGPILNKIYLWNYPDHQISDFEDATTLIYKYLCTNKINTPDAKDINDYLYKDQHFDKKRAYLLAVQLQKIFHEYLYIRTEEMLHLEKSMIPRYQQEIIQYLLGQTSNKKTFLDVYKYFIGLDFNLDKPLLPRQLFIFGLTSAYSSQLQIIKRLATMLPIYWYYKTCSFEYYGNLLSNEVKRKLEQKSFKNPDLYLEDLYLTAGNPILSNLGQQSREFIELLNLHDISIYDFKGAGINSACHPGLDSGSIYRTDDSCLASQTFLRVLQDDILNLAYRIDKSKRLTSNNDYYEDPLRLINSGIDGSQRSKSFRFSENDQDGTAANMADQIKNKIYDLPDNDTSIKINICHNKMREVQVMFNEVAHLLNNGVRYDDILITAPDIDDYAVYINAIFANEYVEDTTGNRYKILCNVTGSRHYSDFAVLEIFNLCINAPYQCSVNYFLEILMTNIMQQALGITLDDVELIKRWLQDNKIYFGFNATDYSCYGYENYAIHSFKQFLANITLGACLSDTKLWHLDPADSVDKAKLTTIVPYDNIDSGQISLCNKLIQLINLLEYVREQLYIDENNYQELSMRHMHEILSKIEDELITAEEELLISQRFFGKILKLEAALTKDITINLPIFNIIFDEYREDFQKNINLNGAITAASMQYVRNIPYKYVYILGLNLGSYPRVYEPNMLSILSKSWYLADRNYTNEDKQTFLDIFLSTTSKIFFSYIGRSETDNSVIEPSPILTQILDTMAESFLDFGGNTDDGRDYRNLIEVHALHPFYKNNSKNYSKFWAEISAQINNDVNSNISEFMPTAYLTHEQQQHVLSQIGIDKIASTFIYTNANIYKALGIRTFKNEDELIEMESFSLENRAIAKELYRYFEKMFDQLTKAELYEYLVANGTLSYKYLGLAQFDNYYALYQMYHKERGQKLKIAIDIPFSDFVFGIKDEIYLENNNIILLDKFENITSHELVKNASELKYEIKIKAMVLHALTLKDRELATYNIVVRDVTCNSEYQDYQVKLNDAAVADAVFNYYLESYKKPTLVHKTAIKKYLATKIEGIKDPYLEAKKAYSSDYQNYDLNRIKEDAIFASVAENYFDFMQSRKLLNDIVSVGELLAAVSFLPVDKK